MVTLLIWDLKHEQWVSNPKELCGPVESKNYMEH